ncbi:MAG: glycosyltransferase family 4 protein [Candidatus Levybacteria bacterium]|nr:glycosyltransferase family 4 protein [Candidatus Levybacteria bacterium]
MNIAIYYNLLFGGAKRVVFEQAKWLKKNGHTIGIYTTDTERDFFDFRVITDEVNTYPFNFKTGNIPVVSRARRDFNVFLSLKNLHKKIASDIDKGCYDVVLAHPDHLTQAPFILKFLKTPSVYYCEEPLRIAYEYSLRFKDNVGIHKLAYEKLTRMYRKKIDRENARAASFPVASCYHIRERMIESYDVYPHVCYPGIETDLFRPLHFVKRNELLFIGGKNVWNDGYDLVEKALSLIPLKERPKLHVIEWKKNGNRLSDEEIVKLYNRVKIVLCLSRFETFGLVPLEAMACGTPVIATKISGHRETVLDKKSGFLVDFDYREIARKIRELFADKSLYEAMSLYARKQMVDEWSWNKRIIDLEKILVKAQRP